MKKVIGLCSIFVIFLIFFAITESFTAKAASTPEHIHLKKIFFFEDNGGEGNVFLKSSKKALAEYCKKKYIKKIKTVALYDAEGNKDAAYPMYDMGTYVVNKFTSRLQKNIEYVFKKTYSIEGEAEVYYANADQKVSRKNYYYEKIGNNYIRYQIVYKDPDKGELEHIRNGQLFYLPDQGKDNLLVSTWDVPKNTEYVFKFGNSKYLKYVKAVNMYADFGGMYGEWPMYDMGTLVLYDDVRYYDFYTNFMFILARSLNMSVNFGGVSYMTEDCTDIDEGYQYFVVCDDEKQKNVYGRLKVITIPRK